MMDVQGRLEMWRSDPIAFVRDVLRNPETNQPFVLYEAQERFLREALMVGPDGRLPYSELVFSAPKKSGKTALAGMVVLYVILVFGGPYAEGYCLSNDYEQSADRVFQQVARMLDPRRTTQSRLAKITNNVITFPSTGATITALASDYASGAGANPTITVFDELWAYTSERAQRLWDEMVPVPTHKISIRLTVTYAGFEGESKLLEELYKRGLAGELIAPDLYRS